MTKSTDLKSKIHIVTKHGREKRRHKPILLIDDISASLIVDNGEILREAFPETHHVRPDDRTRRIALEMLDLYSMDREIERLKGEI